MRIAGVTRSNSTAPMKKPRSWPATRELAPVDDELRAFLDAGIDVAAHALAMRARDERAHVGAVGRAGQPTLSAASSRLQRLDQPVGGVADGDGDRDRHAALAGGAVGRADQRVAAWSRSASGITTMWFLAPPSACTRLPCACPSR